MPPLLSGLLLQASLIVAIGPQNAFVLRREHVGSIVLLCIAADVALLAAGATGVTAAVRLHPAALAVVTWAGVGAMALYGLAAIIRGFRPGALDAGQGAPLSRRAALLRAAAFTFLNPHVYVDAILLVGTVAAAQPPGGTPWFVLGASAAS